MRRLWWWMVHSYFLACHRGSCCWAVPSGREGSHWIPQQRLASTLCRAANGGDLKRNYNHTSCFHHCCCHIRTRVHHEPSALPVCSSPLRGLTTDIHVNIRMIMPRNSGAKGLAQRVLGFPKHPSPLGFTYPRLPSYI